MVTWTTSWTDNTHVEQSVIEPGPGIQRPLLYTQEFMYILCTKYLYKYGQDFLDIQYDRTPNKSVLNTSRKNIVFR